MWFTFEIDFWRKLIIMALDFFNGDKLTSSGRPFEEEAPAAEEVTQLSPEDQAIADAATEADNIRLAEEAANDTRSEEQKQLDADAAKAIEDAAEAAKLIEDAKTPEEKLADQAAIDAQLKEQEDAIAAQRASIRAEYLKELGVESEEALRNKLSAVPLETAEEKVAREEKYNADLLAFGIQNKLLATTDIVALENTKGLTNEDIAFNAFKSEYLEANKDRKVEGTDEAFPVDDSELREEFDNLYHRNSTSAVAKANGERQMNRFAEDAKSEVQNKLEHAKQNFDAHLHKQVNVPAFKNFLETTIKKSIPESIEVPNGEQPFKFKLTDSKGVPLYDVAKIEEALVNDAVYKSYLSEKEPTKPELTKYMNEQVMNIITRENQSLINKELAEFNFEKGLRKGSDTGSKAPFQQKQNPPAVVIDTKVMTPEQKARMAEQYGNPTRR